MCGWSGSIEVVSGITEGVGGRQGLDVQDGTCGPEQLLWPGAIAKDELFRVVSLVQAVRSSPRARGEYSRTSIALCVALELHSRGGIASSPAPGSSSPQPTEKAPTRHGSRAKVE